jgi:hypothetical protein
MGNTWGGTDDTIIAQAGFAAFKAALIPAASFSTSFSDEAAKKGASVNTRIITGMTAGAFAGDYETGDTTTTEIAVALSNHAFRSFHQTDVEASKSSVAPQTMELQAAEAGYSVAKLILEGTMGLVTNTNYSTAGFVGAASGFDSDDVIDLKAAMDTKLASQMNRGLILKDAYYNQLLKDASVKGRDGVFGSDAFASGVIPNIAGFRVYQCPFVPANSENLVGFAVVPAAIALAVRPLAPQAGSEKSLLSYQVMTDTDSGLSLAYRSWYSTKTGTKWGCFEAVYGFAKAGAGIVRITSA